MSLKSWKDGETGQPSFPAKFEVAKKAVLQCSDLVTNHNKYYAIELHKSGGKYRIFTHYGRTDDLETNPNAGVKESRYPSNEYEAEQCYQSIYKQKTSNRKGYQEVNLASSKIGSHKSIGQSSGEVDNKTLAKLKDKGNRPVSVTPTISKDITNLVEFLYNEAVNALTSSVNVSITANGIETPLGVLTLGQIDKGQLILDEIESIVGSKKKQNDILKLSGQFYTTIPCRIGRSRNQVNDAVIDSAKKLGEKNETLQLMRDMLSVNGDSNVLINPEIEKKYQALNCKISTIDADELKKVRSYTKYKIQNAWKIQRNGEHESFDRKVGNNKWLFHGSSSKNWVGILSRGILLPKSVVKLGVHRTDAGWLGHGIYFGDVIQTSLNYAGESKRGTSLISIATVALGKVKKYEEITYGLNAPPKGYDSCHGVSGTEFDDDEFVIYRQNQQKLEYLLEVD